MLGLEEAISLQGGVEYLRNIKIGNAQPLCFHLAVKDDSLSTRNSGWPLIIHSFEYEFSLRLNRRRCWIQDRTRQIDTALFARGDRQRGKARAADGPG